MLSNFLRVYRSPTLYRAVNRLSPALFASSSPDDPSKSKEDAGLVEGVLKWIPNIPADPTTSNGPGGEEQDDDIHLTSLDWTNRIHRQIDEGDIQGAEVSLNKAVRSVGDDGSWIRTARLTILDAWVEHQAILVDKLYNTDVSSKLESTPKSYEERRKTAAERKALIREIASAADSAHNLLERIEPSLGPRMVAELEETIDETAETLRSSIDETIASACNSVLLSWARAVRADQKFRHIYRVRGAPQRAQFLHDRMKLSLSKRTSYPPNEESFKRLLEVWAYSSEHLRAASADKVFRDRAAHTKLGPIDTEAHRLAMIAFALSDERRAAYQATSYLKKMLQVQRDFDKISTVDNTEVTLDDYHVVMKAWARSEEKAAPFKASNLVKHLDEAQKMGLVSVIPDELCYRYLLQTISRKSGQAHFGDLVDETLLKMRNAYMVPDSLCFSYAIATWKNATMLLDATVSEKETSVRRTLDLLSEMDIAHNQSSSVEVVVSTQNVNDALEALSVSDNPRRTELANTLLTRMENEIDDRNFHLMPNSTSYMLAIRIWKSVWSETRVKEAKEILYRMIDRFEVVSKKSTRRNDPVAVFNEFIEVCGSQRVASTEDGLAVLREATNAVQSIRQLNKLVPDASTYAVLLGACVNVLNETPQRSILVKKIFAQCCVEGMVDEEVLQNLRIAITPEEYSDLVIARSEEIEGVKLVPEAWSVRALRGSTITADGRRTVPLGIDGRLTFTRGMLEFQMRRLRDKRNQQLLRGGRLKTTSIEEKPWALYQR